VFLGLFAQAGLKAPNLSSEVARIAGVSHWHPAGEAILKANSRNSAICFVSWGS
jgi:hypothetical protein